MLKSYEELIENPELEEGAKDGLGRLYLMPFLIRGHGWSEMFDECIYQASKLLLQMRESKNGAEVSVNHMKPMLYNDKTLLSFLQEQLVHFLDSKKASNVNGVIGFKSNTEGRVIICRQEDDRYSDGDLKKIIEYYEGNEESRRKYMGNNRFGRGGGAPALGAMVVDVESYLPKVWSEYEKNNFAVDFLLSCGATEFKGKDWNEDAVKWTRKEKFANAKNWVKSYESALKRQEG